MAQTSRDTPGGRALNLTYIWYECESSKIRVSALFGWLRLRPVSHQTALWNNGQTSRYEDEDISRIFALLLAPQGIWLTIRSELHEGDTYGLNSRLGLPFPDGTFGVSQSYWKGTEQMLRKAIQNMGSLEPDLNGGAPTAWEQGQRYAPTFPWQLQHEAFSLLKILWYLMWNSWKKNLMDIL